MALTVLFRRVPIAIGLCYNVDLLFLVWFIFFLFVIKVFIFNYFGYKNM